MNVGRIGRPGVSEKYKQPPGTTLFQYEYNAGAGFNFLEVTRTAEFPSNESITLASDGPPVPYTSVNTIFILELLKAGEASTGWGSTSDPHLDILFEPGDFQGGNYSDSVTMVESPDCDNQNRISVSVTDKIYLFDGNPDFAPNTRVSADFDNAPIGRTTCWQDYIARAKILVPTDNVVKINAQYVNVINKA